MNVKKKKRNSKPNNLLKNFNCQAIHFMPIIRTKKKGGAIWKGKYGKVLL